MVAQLKGYVRCSNDAVVVGLLGEAGGAHTNAGGRECEEKGAQRPENHGHLAPTPEIGATYAIPTGVKAGGHPTPSSRRRNPAARQWLNRAKVHVGHLRHAYGRKSQRRRPKPPPLTLSSFTGSPPFGDDRQGVGVRSREVDHVSRVHSVGVEHPRNLDHRVFCSYVSRVVHMVEDDSIRSRAEIERHRRMRRCRQRNSKAICEARHSTCVVNRLYAVSLERERITCIDVVENRPYCTA